MRIVDVSLLALVLHESKALNRSTVPRMDIKALLAHRAEMLQA